MSHYESQGWASAEAAKAMWEPRAKAPSMVGINREGREQLRRHQVEKRLAEQAALAQGDTAKPVATGLLD